MQALLNESIRAACTLWSQIPAPRIELLSQLSSYIQQKAQEGKPVLTNTICTHNSRRSHLGQVWIQTMAHHFGIPGVRAFSGGTEATACHPHTIAALRAQGFDIEQGEGENPIYRVRYADGAEDVLECWSKKYDDAANPKSEFAAIMVCGSADGACPIVFGADLRLACTYVDPKVSDGTELQSQTYEERSLQIASEMAWVMQDVARKLQLSQGQH